MRDEDKDWVRLSAERVEPKETPVLHHFSLEEIRLDPFDDGSYGQGIKLSLVLKRKMIGELFSTFLPSLLMLVLSHLSSTFQCPFKAAVLLNLASLLVVSMLSFSSLLRQPSKSSFNMVDIWLFTCYLTIISRIVLLMAIKRIESKTCPYKPNNKVRLEKLEIRSNIFRWVMPTKDNH